MEGRIGRQEQEGRVYHSTKTPNIKMDMPGQWPLSMLDRTPSYQSPTQKVRATFWD